jgi:conjugal transfer pilus assembly protein TraE
MDFQKTQKERQLFAQRSVVLGGLLALSLTSTAVLSLCLMNSSQIILVPTLPADASLDANGHVDAEYLEDMSRDVAWLFLNKTPETSRYFERKAQRIMDPTSFEGVKVALEKESARAEATHTSQAFFPDDFFEDPSNLYSEVRGRLVIMQGTQVIDDQPKIYALHWSKTGTLVRLLSIAEIDPKDARGEKVKPIQTSEDM